jgi:hypothetical protein
VIAGLGYFLQRTLPSAFLLPLTSASMQPDYSLMEVIGVEMTFKNSSK